MFNWTYRAAKFCICRISVNNIYIYVADASCGSPVNCMFSSVQKYVCRLETSLCAWNRIVTWFGCESTFPANKLSNITYKLMSRCLKPGKNIRFISTIVNMKLILKQPKKTTSLWCLKRFQKIGKVFRFELSAVLQFIRHTFVVGSKVLENSLLWMSLALTTQYNASHSWVS